jgi:hypothetical protein
VEQLGISEAIGAILVFAVAVLCLSVYYTSYLMQEAKRSEVRHAQGVREQFLSLKEAVGRLDSGEVTVTVPMTPEPVSGLLYSPPSPRPGRMEVDNSGQGSIRYLSSYTSSPNFSLLFEGGAVILVQGDFSSFVSPPALFGRENENTVRTVEYLVRGGGSLSMSGEACVRVRVRAEESVQENVRYQLTPRPETLELWREYLETENRRLSLGADLKNEGENLRLIVENVRWRRVVVELDVSLGI